ncbi:hypothetical protein K504DRAFT_501072 [Pleomassaria siparia CBS 279.74]|uniref:Uncharacterized protein n=1 Tax=Pleomassaria siparia CBS 279.74 TaxID=1314801 RepID=A0A6G1KF20_9PLEO|nr:hypothetical protein K504DRAFT_501072 [Pleomassaria siparia CBS 279.74]
MANQSHLDMSKSLEGTASQKSLRREFHACLVTRQKAQPQRIIAIRSVHTKSFKIHLIMQSVANVGILVKYFLDTHMSKSPLHLVGAPILILVPLQVFIGHRHHVNLRKLGTRTKMSHWHIWADRDITDQKPFQYSCDKDVLAAGRSIQGESFWLVSEQSHNGDIEDSDLEQFIKPMILRQNDMCYFDMTPVPRTWVAPGDF